MVIYNVNERLLRLKQIDQEVYELRRLGKAVDHMSFETFHEVESQKRLKPYLLNCKTCGSEPDEEPTRLIIEIGLDGKMKSQGRHCVPCLEKPFNGDMIDVEI